MKLLKLGSRGKDVEKVQERLRAWGFELDVDGIFGKISNRCIDVFQRGMSLYPDKKVGSITMGALESDPVFVTHFKASNFRCRCDGKYCGGYPSSALKYPINFESYHSFETMGIDYALLLGLERLRLYIGELPIHITSGLRCYWHNKAVGGAAGSQHKMSRAADFYVNEISVRDMNVLTDQLFPYSGVGLRGNTITHLDFRPKHARWYYN